MTRIFGAVLSLFLLVPFVGVGQAPQKFFTGAKRTPFERIAAAIRAGSIGIHKPLSAPPSVLTVPKRLSYWGNNQYGCCVTSESVFAISDYSTFLGLPQIFVTEAVTIKWARDHGYLNGAFLLEVIESMQKDGVLDENNKLRKAGTASVVNYGDQEALKSAIAQGPVSIAIASGSLPSGAGNKSGWYSFGGRYNPNTDHCVSLHGYGETRELFEKLGVALPPNIPVSGYYLFTWSTIGVVDHQWLTNTCVEAWVRNPTTTELVPPPPPIPVDIAVTVANVSGTVGVPVKFNPLASGGTSPYYFVFEYGDSTGDGAGQHIYKADGTYSVKVSAVDSRGNIGTGKCVASIGTLPPLPPTPSGATVTLPQDTKAGTYQLVNPADLEALQRQIDAIRGKESK